MILHKRNQGLKFFYLSELKQDLPYGLGLERRETRKEGGFQLLASIHLELNSSETQLCEKRTKWSVTSSRVDLRSLLSVE